MCVISSTIATVIGIAGSVVSTGLGMAAQYVQGREQAQATKSQADWNKKVAEDQALASERAAGQAIKRGEVDASRQAAQAAQRMGDYKTFYAASGFDVNTGSKARALEDQAAQEEYDVTAIRSNAGQEAWQHRVDAHNARQNAGLYAQQSKNSGSMLGTYLGMTGTGLSGVASGINTWNRLKDVSGAPQTKMTTKVKAW